MSLPTNRSVDNTEEEHVDDHNTLHALHNDIVDNGFEFSATGLDTGGLPVTASDATDPDHLVTLSQLESTTNITSSQLAPGGTDRLYYDNGWFSPERIEFLPRIFVDAGNRTISSGTCYIIYGTFAYAKTVDTFITETGSTAGVYGTTPGAQTRILLATVASNGTYTAVARSTLATSTRWVAANTEYEDLMYTTGGSLTTYDILPNVLYAGILLWDTKGSSGATVPSFAGKSSGGAASARQARSPRMTGTIAAASNDIPTTGSATGTTSNLIRFDLKLSTDSGT